MKVKILIVDDDSIVVEFLRETLDFDKYELHSAHSAESALERLKTESFEIILSDIRMGQMDGMEMLTHVRERSPKTIVIMMTGFGSVETAVLAMKLGAFDFIMKPMSPESVQIRVQKAVEHLKLKRQVTALKLDSARRYSDIVGSSKPMTHIFDRIRLAAPSKATVLITGESGTGKELIARAIHEESDRADGPFVKLNCAALNQNLIESELFGHEKGAFTGAIQARSGRFELANGGTLLLDEISEMPYETQAKLLRTLQEREIEKVGSAETVKIDVRIIASSNRDLPVAIAEGHFREDLFFRLNVIGVEV
ncbi:sigma-54-dependent Fis family transcriptional regulator, partial [bacterium AH-315-J21]|nr:sigma-54-dependent Fis family transcriptional regulator [bacterium AH-315-J21]